MKRIITTPIWRTILTALLIAVVAAVVFGYTTRGFQTVTAEGVRRIDLARSPRPLPGVQLIDSNGKAFRLSEINEHATFVTWVYTRCVSICRSSTSGQAYLQQEIRARGLENRVQLLTLSFDPASDTPEALSGYARQMKADTTLWKFGTVADPNDLAALLKLFGIVVLPDELDGYSHNAALFLVDRQARLIRAYDIDRPDLALANLLKAQGV